MNFGLFQLKALQYILLLRFLRNDKYFYNHMWFYSKITFLNSFFFLKNYIISLILKSYFVHKKIFMNLKPWNVPKCLKLPGSRCLWWKARLGSRCGGRWVRYTSPGTTGLWWGSNGLWEARGSPPDTGDLAGTLSLCVGVSVFFLSWEAGLPDVIFPIWGGGGDISTMTCTIDS